MSFEPGHTLLHYRLIEKIGEGGMGVVWKARDTRLDRDVALKILPDSVAKDSDRLARFEREAKAVAALAHPNILAVYDFGREGDTTYMVTELLDGESLRERLGEGALPARKAAELARQIARGLAAAHKKDFVHRDLKPDNIYITPEGRAKILDFGLAASTLQEDGKARPTDTPTRTELTTPGAVMGTADYMSPEQVRGEKVDHRSDIFSFGSLLYEMIAGRQPFRRDTMAETMTAVLRDDPPSHSADGGELPPGLERVVRRCLEKRPEERFQSASDLAFAVDSAVGTSTVTAERIEAVAEPAPRRAGTAVAIVAMVAMLVGGVFIGRLIAPKPPSQPTYAQVTFRQGRISSARFAADGQTIVYAADWDGEGLRVFTVQQGTPESRPLGVEDAEILSVSSQGEMALLLRPRFTVGWTRRGTLARMPLGGEAPREMLDGISSADWDPSGEELAIVRIEGSISRLEYPPGRVLYETDGWLGDLRFSRDGKRIAFAEHPHVGDNRGFVAVAELEGNAARLGEVWSTLEGVEWSPNGDEIWFTAGEQGTSRALFAVDLEGVHRAVARGPVDLVLHDVGADGRALMARSNLSRGIIGRPPGATEEVTLTWLDWSFLDVLSEDGQTVVFTEQGEGGGPGYSTILRPTAGGAAVRLGPGQAMAISRDGSKVLSRLIDGTNPLVIYPTGPGAIERIELPGLLAAGVDWTAGEQELLVIGSLDGSGFRGYRVTPSSTEYVPVTDTDITLASIAFHRDLGLLAARVIDGPIRIFPLDGGEARTLSLGPEMTTVGWSRDGRWLYLGDWGKKPSPVWRYDVQRDSGEAELMWEVMPAESAGLIDIGPLLVNPDADAYAYSYRRDLSILYLASGF